MTFKKTLLAVMIPFMLTACGIFKDIKNVKIGQSFEQSSKDYIKLVRWNELDSALVTYVSPPLREEYQKRITAAGGVKIADYRVKLMVCDPVKGEATVKVEFDYYRPPSTRVHTVEDLQKWAYEGDKDQRNWRLKSLLPEFK